MKVGTYAIPLCTCVHSSLFRPDLFVYCILAPMCLLYICTSQSKLSITFSSYSTNSNGSMYVNAT